MADGAVDDWPVALSPWLRSNVDADLTIVDTPCSLERERHWRTVRVVCGRCGRGLVELWGTVEDGVTHRHGPGCGVRPHIVDVARDAQQRASTTSGRVASLQLQPRYRCSCGPPVRDYPVRRDRLDQLFRVAAAHPRRRERVITLPDDLAQD